VPASLPASGPVTRSKEPLVVVPSCLAPEEFVSAGFARSQRPVVAVSVSVVQPVALSNVSLYTGAVTGPHVWLSTSYGQSAASSNWMNAARLRCVSRPISEPDG